MKRAVKEIWQIVKYELFGIFQFGKRRRKVYMTYTERLGFCHQVRELEKQIAKQ